MEQFLNFFGSILHGGWLCVQIFGLLTIVSWIIIAARRFVNCQPLSFKEIDNEFNSYFHPILFPVLDWIYALFGRLCDLIAIWRRRRCEYEDRQSSYCSMDEVTYLRRRLYKILLQYECCRSEKVARRLMRRYDYFAYLLELAEYEDFHGPTRTNTTAAARRTRE